MNKEKQRFFIETFGCQMNVNDSEKVAGLLLAEGHAAAESADDADFVFINTCAVREKAAEKLYSALGRLERKRRARTRPEQLRIGVGGCVAQLHGEEITQRAPQIDVLVGTHTLNRVPELLRKSREQGVAQVDLDRRADSFTVPFENVAHSNPYRAYVTVIEGCNHVCSFCVVPRTRGPEACRPADDVIAEVRALVARGVPEVMLLGQTVNAYEHGGVDFADLLLRVETSVPGLQRLRFTTSHPSHMTAEMARRLGQLRLTCPYIHLPVQSGSDRILDSMRRGYSVLQYEETIARLRAEIDGLALSSDVIVGYPGETEADFEATLALVQRSRFDGLFVFTYSARPGTTALRLEDDVGEAEKQRRLEVLNSYQQRVQGERNQALIGRVFDVLVEARSKDGRLMGRTPQFKIVHFAGEEGLMGRIVPVEILAAGPNALQGTQAIH
jgi:tRNA-2-methylthio-N6-dimethylallyladenosine synthase